MNGGQPKIEMVKGLRHRYSSEYVGGRFRTNVQQYNDGQNFVESRNGNKHVHQIVAKNPHAPELRAEKGEAEYIKYNDKNLLHTYEQGKAINKKFDEITQEMENNKVDLLDLFSPYKL